MNGSKQIMAGMAVKQLDTFILMEGTITYLSAVNDYFGAELTI